MVSVRPHGNKRAAYRWYLTSGKASQFLQAVLPYLIVKKAEAVLAIGFQNSKVRSCKRLSPDVINERQAMMSRLSALKCRIRKPRNLGVTIGPVSKK